ncbi:hypothetical protein EVAR_2942_1 [Eumeta japonica]|uniref:Uncharacterized protein n=1 Tax=Eumeta variegata TaxID=151549 RepID=A0A4C1T1S1_EUMVA|nr:hypothetical protein EVAR_2942_1 [Eumeta japonica]
MAELTIYKTELLFRNNNHEGCAAASRMITLRGCWGWARSGEDMRLVRGRWRVLAVIEIPGEIIGGGEVITKEMRAGPANAPKGAHGSRLGCVH